MLDIRRWGVSIGHERRVLCACMGSNGIKIFKILHVPPLYGVLSRGLLLFYVCCRRYTSFFLTVHLPGLPVQTNFRRWARCVSKNGTTGDEIAKKVIMPVLHFPILFIVDDSWKSFRFVLCSCGST